MFCLILLRSLSSRLNAKVLFLLPYALYNISHIVNILILNLNFCGNFTFERRVNDLLKEIEYSSEERHQQCRLKAQCT